MAAAPFHEHSSQKETRFLLLHSLASAKIADVAVTKRHQTLDEIRIIFTHTSSKSYFQKSLSYNTPAIQCNPVQTAYFCTLAINTRVLHCMRLLEMRMLPRENNFADSSIVWVKMITISCCC